MREFDRRALCYLTASISGKLTRARDPRSTAAGEAAERAVIRRVGKRTAVHEKATVEKIMAEIRRVDPAVPRTVSRAQRAITPILEKHGRLVAPLGSEETFAGAESYYKRVKGAWAKDFDAPFTFAHADEVALRRITRFDNAWIGNHYRDDVTRQAARTIARVAAEQGGALSRRELARRLAQEMPGVVKAKGYFEVLASAAITHARGYSSANFYSEARIDVYEVLAVDDDRTSEICKMMNGKQFSVSRTLNNYARMDAASTPDEAKDAWPWMREAVRDGERIVLLRDGTVAGDLTAEELQGRGYDAPPYHGRCRSTIIPALS